MLGFCDSKFFLVGRLFQGSNVRVHSSRTMIRAPSQEATGRKIRAGSFKSAHPTRTRPQEVFVFCHPPFSWLAAHLPPSFLTRALTNLVKNREQTEKDRFPMNRIVNSPPSAVRIKTTARPTIAGEARETGILQMFQASLYNASTPLLSRANGRPSVGTHARDTSTRSRTPDVLGRAGTPGPLISKKYSRTPSFREMPVIFIVV